MGHPTMQTTVNPVSSGEEIAAEKASDRVVRKCISAAPECSTP
jgi:hypothetical protein